MHATAAFRTGPYARPDHHTPLFPWYSWQLMEQTRMTSGVHWSRIPSYVDRLMSLYLRRRWQKKHEEWSRRNNAYVAYLCSPSVACNRRTKQRLSLVAYVTANYDVLNQIELHFLIIIQIALANTRKHNGSQWPKTIMHKMTSEFVNVQQCCGVVGNCHGLRLAGHLQWRHYSSTEWATW